MSVKILELNFAPDQLPLTIEIVETVRDRFGLTAESLASLTESQLEWLNGNISINITDYQKLLDFRTDLIKTIDEDFLSMKTLQIPSIGDTSTVYSRISPRNDLILENEMPDVLSQFNERAESALQRQASLAQPSSNFLQTTIMLATNDPLDLQDWDADMSLEAKIPGDTFKSNFCEFWNKTCQKKTRESLLRTRKKILVMSF